MMPGEFIRPACRPSGYSSGEAPHGISYHASRATRALAGSLGWSMNSKHFPLCLHTMLIVGPRARQDVRRRRMVVGRPQAPSLRVGVQQPYRALFPDESHGEGTNVRFGASSARPEPETIGHFSLAIPGWLGTRNGLASCDTITLG
jgi:hypothetical protein